MTPRFPRLNLPPVKLNIRCDEEGRLKVFDSLRRKFVALTPEEYVRQHFTDYLVSALHYPGGLMANEVSITLNGLHRRCDTLVSDRSGRPWMIVEYKAPDVNITQDVFDQAARYNLVTGARYLVVSNGMRHYCCRMDVSDGKYHFIPGIPDWREAEFSDSIN